MKPPHEIENIEVDLFVQALRQRYGYGFEHYAKASLKRRLRNLKEYLDVPHLTTLLPRLLYDETLAQVVVNTITVQVSSFFRDPDVWRSLRQDILPRLGSYPMINIWQAGCSHGEETYSLLILLKELGLLHKSHIFATDINKESLAIARKGRWPKEKLIEWSENYAASGGSHSLSDYLSVEAADCMIDPELRQRVDFMEHNLDQDDCFVEAQLVVCRNVLIYFDNTLQQKVIRLFYDSLQRGGTLVLGNAENINHESLGTLFIPTHNEQRIFRRVMSEVSNCTGDETCTAQ